MSRRTKHSCKQILLHNVSQQHHVLLAGDFNMSPDSVFIKQLKNMCKGFHFITDQKLKRCNGFRRTVDYIFTNFQSRKIDCPQALQQLSDHQPILIYSGKLSSLKIKKNIPSAVATTQYFQKQITHEEFSKDPMKIWKQVFGKSLMVEPKQTQFELYEGTQDMGYEAYIRKYLETYSDELEYISKRRFTEQSALFFKKLKALSGYSIGGKEGSIASCCKINGKIIVGKEFQQLIKLWYQNIPDKFPHLKRKKDFPRVQITDLEIKKLLSNKSKFSKAISFDCLGGWLFNLEEQINSEIRRKNQNKIKLVRKIFEPQFWEMEESKVALIGRLILLNKDHPQIPVYGRFRPIRVQSNITKVLQLYLYQKLNKFSSNYFQQQFGFVPQCGCETARVSVFQTLSKLRNQNKHFHIIQVDLTCAYNTVNLLIMKEIITRHGFWLKEEVDLWEFLATNNSTKFNNISLREWNGLAQGSILSPQLFILYFDDLLAQLREYPSLTAIAYADDLILIGTDLDQLRKGVRALKRFCNERKLRINYDKSDFLSSFFPSKQFQGFLKRKSAIYLGLNYRPKLDIKFSLDKLNKRIEFMLRKLYRFLKSTNLRICLNLYIILCKPLIRMTLSILGFSECQRARKGFEQVRKYERKCLRKFLLLPRNADSAFIDFLSQADNNKYMEILSKCNKRIDEKIGSYFLDPNEWDISDKKEDIQELVIQARKVRFFHPNTVQILKLVNNYFCSSFIMIKNCYYYLATNKRKKQMIQNMNKCLKIEKQEKQTKFQCQQNII